MSHRTVRVEIELTEPLPNAGRHSIHIDTLIRGTRDDAIERDIRRLVDQAIAGLGFDSEVTEEANHG